MNVPDQTIAMRIAPNLYQEAMEDEAGVETQPVFSHGLTLATVIVCILAGLVIAVTGGVVTYRAGRIEPVALAAGIIGAVLFLWHLASLIRGAGRNSPQVHAVVLLGLIATLGFGLITGYGLFEMLSLGIDRINMALFVTGLAGLVASLVIVSRDSDIADSPVEEVQPQRRPEKRAPRVASAPAPDLSGFTEAAGTNEMVQRGSFPLPRRGSGADTQIWSEFEEEAPQAPPPPFPPPQNPNRARRAL